MVRLEDSDDAIIGYSVGRDGSLRFAYDYFHLVSIHAQLFHDAANPHARASQFVYDMVEAFGLSAPLVIFPADKDIAGHLESAEVRH